MTVSRKFWIAAGCLAGAVFAGCVDPSSLPRSAQVAPRPSDPSETVPVPPAVPPGHEMVGYTSSEAPYQSTATTTESQPAESKSDESESAPTESGDGLADPSTIEITSGGPVIPPGRPAWVEAKLDPEQASPKVAVSSGPQVTDADCEAALNAKIKAKADQYVDAYTNSSLASTLLQLNAASLRSQLVEPTNVYRETITTSVGPMRQTHALVEFSPAFRQQIDRQWLHVRSWRRLGGVALAGFLGFALLLTGVGYLRADTATRGLYTTRLKLAAGAAILATAAAGYIWAQRIVWI